MNENKHQTPASDEFENPHARTQEMPEQGRAAAADAPDSQQKSRGRKRGLLIGAAAVAALVAVGGSAYAIGANIGDDDRDRSAAVAGDRSGHDGDDADDEAAGGHAQPDDSAAGRSGASQNLPPTDAAALREAAELAIADSDAQGASSIDVERGGYEIETQLADGSEPDVFVTVDGTVTTGTDRPDSDRPDPILDLTKLEDISRAALAAAAEAGGADGAIDSISSSDDRGVAYEVSVRLPDGRDADIELADDLGVVTSDIDDD